ncbi:MAG: multicopper oxidase domain-containing protein [Methylococcaceae bacterium]|nr:multicopper oxidase domain-containing protein [Methylococcaceae bacterium]
MKYNYFKLNPVSAGLCLALMTGSGIAVSAPSIQCPGDWDGDGDVNWRENGVPVANVAPHLQKVKCLHLSAGDGFINTADGKALYTFGFGDLTGQTDTKPATPKPDPILAGRLNAEFPGTMIVLDEGDELYLTLTNVAMVKRPDLFDAHTVHYHGFPNASSFWDGVPENTVSINQGASFTYFYKNVEPGTYMYHCHVEATEHMEMGMLGNLYVRPKQDGTLYTYAGKSYTKFAYNDGDGSTGYDIDVPVQLGGMDFDFHDDHIKVQPLPFAALDVDYPMINGRGYPDTIKPDNHFELNPGLAQVDPSPDNLDNEGNNSQPLGSLITATAGDKILLRTSSLNITRFFTLTAQGLKMQVVGQGARQMRGPTGLDTSYKTNSITLGGGEAMDVMIDTTGITPGTYFVYTTNLNYLSNNDEDYGGMMTEIVIN